MNIMISACLLGYKVRYDGSDKLNQELIDILKDHILIPICPEYLAGFSIPHPPIEYKDGRYYTNTLKDVTEIFENGAKLAFDECVKQGVDLVILKTKSPSCGKDLIYDGSFKGNLIKGNGAFTQLLIKNNIATFKEDQIQEIIDYIKEKSSN